MSGWSNTEKSLQLAREEKYDRPKTPEARLHLKLVLDAVVCACRAYSPKTAGLDKYYLKTADQLRLRDYDRAWLEAPAKRNCPVSLADACDLLDIDVGVVTKLYLQGKALCTAVENNPTVANKQQLVKFIDKLFNKTEELSK